MRRLASEKRPAPHPISESAVIHSLEPERSARKLGFFSDLLVQRAPETPTATTHFTAVCPVCAPDSPCPNTYPHRPARGGRTTSLPAVVKNLPLARADIIMDSARQLIAIRGFPSFWYVRLLHSCARRGGGGASRAGRFVQERR